jgi:tRNA(Arg) A34 adenosine deaminase TadA
LSAARAAADAACMRQALALAAQSVGSSSGGPFGALVVRDGRVLGRGANRVTTANDPTAHAEIVAIREACAALQSFSLAGAELYASCEPCPMCLGAIWWARIERVHYAGTRADAAEAGFDDAALWNEVARPLESRALPLQPLLRDEARAVFKAWLEKADRVAY